MANRPICSSPFFLSQLTELNPLYNRIAKVASVLHQHGWAEANAGNLSIRITELIKPKLTKLGINCNDCSLFLVSRSGSRYRNIADNPPAGLLLVKLEHDELRYPTDAVPTSEWECHKIIHNADTNGEYPCILHAHPTEVIALSQSEAYNNSALLSAYLASLLPELPLYLPGGIVATNYAMPGSSELAKLSVENFSDKKALIWQGHGLVCRGKDIDETLDYMEIVNKAAKLHFLLR